MKKKILISDSVNIGTLGDFLDFIQILRKEFEIEPVEIKEIHSDDRDMYIKFSAPKGVIAIDYSYEDEKIYLDCIVGDLEYSFIDEISIRIKELVTIKK
ncbi:Uncharacterised protein [uncultured Clostridium sp.]|nr:Uncharacterised protein [uncultured Clostridium sp.]